MTDRDPDTVLAVDEALTLLERDDPSAAMLARLHLFVGCSVEEAADALGISRTSAYRDWTYARARLSSLLGDRKSE